MVTRTTTILAVLLLAATWSYGQPAVTGVLNAGSYSGFLAPGTIASFFGSGFATGTTVAPQVPLPLQLGGATVTVGGVTAPIWAVSPTQINAVIPFELSPNAAGTATKVVVTTAAGASAPFSVTLQRDAPALLTLNSQGTGTAIAWDSNYHQITALGSAAIGMYAVGLGPTNPAPVSSAAGGATSEPFNRIQDSLAVFVGDQKATIAYAGLAPGYSGIYQLNVVPNGPISDRVCLQVNGVQSNVVSLPLTAGSNVANVTGSIDGLYPSTTSTPSTNGITASVMLMAATFSTSFDIAPGAKPFSIVATTDAGAAIINVDPVLGTWQGTLPVPTAAERNGDFSTSGFTAFDFFSCGTTIGCFPLPANLIPVSRMDPLAAQAQQLLPLPSGPATGGTATSTISGTLSGSHFSLSSTAFGNFLQIPSAGQSSRPTTFHLYVDGKLIASKDVTYSVL